MGSKKLNTSRAYINRVTSLTTRFYADDCYGKACSLSFYTLLSIVPLLAIAFGVAKGFGFEALLEEQILESFAQQPEFTLKIVTWAKNALENAHGSLIAGVGVIFLFWSSLGLIGQLENSLNFIWRIPSSRSFGKKIVDYLPLLIFGPLYLIVTSSFTFFVISQVVQISIALGLYNDFMPAIYGIYYLLLLIIGWIFFSTIYLYLPNQSLPWKVNILAALIAAFSFQVVQISYIHFQLFLSNYNAIYGSFAAFPLFLIWIQISWLITLAGAEIAAHSTSFIPGITSDESITENELCLFLIQQESNLSEDQALTLSTTHSIPLHLVKQALNKCSAAGLLAKDAKSLPAEEALARLMQVDKGIYHVGKKVSHG